MQHLNQIDLLIITVYFIFQLSMQKKIQSKSKLPQYYSLKEYDSIQECKKQIKPTNPKSNTKIKSNKKPNQSKSKAKPQSKIVKQNQNFNSVNMTSQESHKIKNAHEQVDNLKKQNRNEDKFKRNSSERLMKTKSVSKIHVKSQRKAVSPSPLCSRQPLSQHQQKYKFVRNATSRSERQKKAGKKPKQQQNLNKTKSKKTLVNPDLMDRSARNRISIKTEISSKTHSVIRQQGPTIKMKPKKTINKQIKSERNRPFKMPKPSQTKIQSIVQRSILYSQVSFQQCNGQHPYQSAFITNDKYFLPYPDLKSVKTQGCQLDNKSHHSIKSFEAKLNKAAIKIQKVFRGYITRKYIDQAKYIISKVKTIQVWWRKVLSIKKEKLNQKIVSSSNSLITIKDFNDTFKTDRVKLFSQSKENTLSNNKINFKELIKNILQENQQSQNEDRSRNKQDSFESSKEKNLSKDVYIQLKIQDEIKSQRKFNFNSPKSLGSPNSAITPTNVNFNIKEMFSNGGSNQKNKIKELLQSPRMTSPQQLKTTPQQLKTSPQRQILQDVFIRQKNNSTLSQTIEPFQTNFALLEQFCLLTVNYFRDKPHQMQKFITKLSALKQFRTSLILKNWNTHTICFNQNSELDQTLPADYQYLQVFERPILFDRNLRDDIIEFPQIQIQLLGKRFNLESPISAPIHRTFLQFAFDVLEQAFYQQHRCSILAYGKSLNKYIFQTQQSLFEHYFSSALGQLFKWGEILCGLLAQIPEQQIIKQQRMKEFLKRIEPWDLGMSQSMALKIEASQSIMHLLVQQMQRQMLLLI